MMVYDCHGLQNHMLAKSRVTLEIEKVERNEQEEHSTKDRYSTLCTVDRVEHPTTRILLCGALLDIIAWISPH